MNKPEAEVLDLYWNFVRNRQRVWWRKEIRKKPAPWSKDPILQNNFFTNMYRELDPGTQFVTNLIWNSDDGLSVPDKTFWILFYRYTGSDWRGWKSASIFNEVTPTTAYNAKGLKKAFRKLDTPFGNAYLVYPMTNEQTGKDKVELVLDAFGEIARVWPERWNAIQRAIGPQAAYQAIRSARTGIGPFTGYQAWIDYCMLGLITDWRNEWVMPGPGAIKGSSILWGQELSAKQAAGACHYLWDAHHDVFDWDKPYWLEHPLYLSDIQNTLCEFSKYMRVYRGGHARRYQPK